jgi:hypothetical protein
MTFRESIQAAVTVFVEELMSVIRTAAIGDLDSDERPAARVQTRAKAPESKPARLVRRTPEQIAAVAADITALLRKCPKGLRAEEIRDKLGLDRRELPRVLQQAVKDKQIKVLGGQKRSTVYGMRKPSKKPAKKTMQPVKPAAKSARKTKKAAAPRGVPAPVAEAAA